MTNTIPPTYQLHPADAMLHASHTTGLHCAMLSLAESRMARLQTRWALVYSSAVWALYRRAPRRPEPVDQALEPLEFTSGYRLHCLYTLQEGPVDLELRTARQIVTACHE